MINIWWMSQICLILCSNVVVQNITVHSPSTSPYTSGIVPGLFECFAPLSHSSVLPMILLNA